MMQSVDLLRCLDTCRCCDVSADVDDVAERAQEPKCWATLGYAKQENFSPFRYAR